MPHAEVTVTLPPAVWIGAVSREYPEATFRVLSAVPREEDGFGLVEVRTETPDAVLEWMREAPGLTAVEAIRRDPEGLVVQFETTEPLLLASVQASGVPLSLPVEIRDGRAHLELTASRDRIAALGEAFDDLGVTYSLDRLYESVEAAAPLTEKQREVLLEALERGYYDTPRTTTLSDLADELGMANSTLSEILHRAEEAVVKSFVADRLDTDLDVAPPDS
ncbi:helix-turn-helix domain-containing protein [Haloglomus litoreum]|uniref:helix-turn-helix domain-containing protein n=1 Tax=Haloglomus litoreum TaxID=3034026 RepID=UPI0023E858FD|nr:helix-turn-helix domain-containing protein [Haloglomus sp. DT116]